MWKPVLDFFDRHQSFLVTTHVNPDGDALGSEMAIRSLLLQMGKDVMVVNSSPTPETLAFLDPNNVVDVYEQDVGDEVLDQVDAIVIVDVNNFQHLGRLGKLLYENRLPPRACIDHHVKPADDFADVIASDTTAAATGLLTYELTRAAGKDIPLDIANAMYTALITDTGTFRFSNTDARALRVAAELIDLGVNAFESHREAFGKKTWAAARLLGPVMSTVSTTDDGRIAWVSATREMIETAGATYEDMDGFADLVRGIRGVDLVLFFKETDPGLVKISLRSNGPADAYEIANHFGGGGHRMAAGMRMRGTLDEVIKRVVKACREMMG